MDSQEPPPCDEADARAALPRGRPVLAWIAIALLVSLVVVLQAMRPAPPAAESPAGVAVEFQFRYLVGVEELLPLPPGQAFQQAQTLNAGGLEQRLRFACLAGELEGPASALRALEGLEREFGDGSAADDPSADAADAGAVAEAASAEDRTALRLLAALYRDYMAGKWGAPTLTEADRACLVQRLGFAGRLALHPAQGPDSAGRQAVLASAQRTAGASLGGLLGLACVGCLGLGGVVLLAALFVTGRLKSAIGPAREHSGVYAETFALWLLLVILLGLLAGFVVGDSLLANAAVTLLSLTSLAYPVARGIPWSEVRRDIGWTVGGGPRELVAGVAAYTMILPLAAVGGLATALLLLLVGGLGGEVAAPSHPIVSQVSSADLWQMAVVLLAASIVAPLVEETAFRGVLHRHLRDATRRWGAAASFLVSGLLGGLLFAAIHPQGLLAAPALSSIALGLAIAREWRGTLLPSMLAHGIHNGVLMLLLMAAAG